ncbi:uncharacterized protein PHACADRAFT_194144 [Phanerochaete carnosa HHB-10118-sp]|uniref:Uncharacterized protein n=1 Tax=Phanerochaete carnosa (strain HHB-10118-sp) TaxID=650164 RepID=K5X199_PHACS|nr:uncharacterized protein PHACADRAFT_194144 [Phanerochaete carnosa HHB-10118-sp]EKM56542.1 hypothetical protein PHACADRAFT_194144 [Phanerochaete carnosa HHB-10118-sp]
MDAPETYNDCHPLSPSSTTVKVEPASLDSGHSLLHSPPSSRSSSRAARYSNTTSSTRYKRKYSQISPRGELSIMTHPYGNWSSTGLKDEQNPSHRGFSGGVQPSGSNRRGGSGDQQHFYNPESYSQAHDQYRSASARHLTQVGTSSLSGAMGELGLSTHSPSNASPSGMPWTPSPTSGLSGSYVVAPPAEEAFGPYLATPNTSLHSDSPPNALLSYQQYNSSYSGSGSPTHALSSSYPDQFTYHQQQSRAAAMQPPTILPSPVSTSPTGMAMNASPSSMTTPSISMGRSLRGSQERPEDEVRALRARYAELEHKYHTMRSKAEHLEKELQRVAYGSSPNGLPTPFASPSDEGWRSRTETRVKLFCSLNRAGNALCAWHDSRRERRAYPPRMAPPNTLNCGCTYEEALFEESLARHGVGSYHPGENVRMDPALRNPLLKLLRERYGYRDGDFERDPVTGEWVESEGPARWEAKLAQGGPASKKIRVDDRR